MSWTPHLYSVKLKTSNCLPTMMTYIGTSLLPMSS